MNIILYNAYGKFTFSSDSIVFHPRSRTILLRALFKRTFCFYHVFYSGLLFGMDAYHSVFVLDMEFI